MDKYREMLLTCPAGRALLAELDAAMAGGGRPDLTAIWRATGRPRGRSPRRWVATRGELDRIVDEGGGPDGRVLGDYEAAMRYAGWLDRTGIVSQAVAGVIMDGILANAGPMLARDHAGLIGMVAKLGLICRGLSQEEAARQLTEEVKQFAAAQARDGYEEELLVARGQRAIAEIDLRGQVFDGDGNPLA